MKPLRMPYPSLDLVTNTEKDIILQPFVISIVFIG